MNHDLPPNRQIARFANAYYNENNAASRDLLRRLLRASTQALNLQERHKFKKLLQIL